MQLTKQRVIALLLGSTYAQTNDEYLLIYTALKKIAGQVSGLADGQTAWPYQNGLSTQSGPNCDPWADNSVPCDAEGEVCGLIYSTLVRDEGQRWCFNPENCNTIARLTSPVADSSTYNYRVICPDESEGGELPYLEDIAGMITNLENTFLSEEEEVRFSGYYNVLFTPKDQFTTGYWEPNSAGLEWTKYENDIAQCTLDTDCDLGKKCVSWPNEFNKVCKPSFDDSEYRRNVCVDQQNLRPFEPWRPTCDGDPVVAFYDAEFPTQKDDLLTEDYQDYLFEGDYFDTLTAVQQSEFSRDLLAWRTECKESILGTASVESCTKANRLFVMARRRTIDYYTKTAQEKLALDPTIAEGAVLDTELAKLEAFYDTDVPNQKNDLLAEDILFKGEVYETLSTTQKSEFIADSLAWRTGCKDTIKGKRSVESCAKAERLLVEAERVTQEYFTKTAEERLGLDDTIDQQILLNKAQEIFNSSRELDSEVATSSRFEAEQLAADYDSMTNAQKAVFLLSVVSWRSQISQACSEAPNEYQCVRYIQVRTDLFDRMIEASYWSQTDAKRLELDDSILEDISDALVESSQAAENNLRDQDNATIESVTGSEGTPSNALTEESDFKSTVAESSLQANFDTFVTVDAVKIKTSDAFEDAVLLQNAVVTIGQTKCGNVPAEVNEDFWYTVTCNDPLTSNFASITNANGIVINQVQFKLAAEQDTAAIGTILFDLNKPKAGKSGFACDYDGVAIDENEQGTRPSCDATLCCGHAFASGDEDKEDRTQVEVCGGEESVEYIYKPLWNSDPATWVFECIEGSSKIAATAAALILGMISMI